MAEHFNVGKSGVGFMEYFELIKGPLGSELTQKESMRRLNSARVELKHHGTLPAKMSVEGFRSGVTDFLETNVPLVFGLDFGSVSLIDLTSGSAAYPLLQKAQAAADGGKFQDALNAAAEAFAVVIDEYEETKRSTFGRSPFFFGENLTFLKSFHMGMNRHETMAEFVDKMQESVVALQQAMKILSLGLDYRRYTRFRLVTPVVTKTIGGPRIVTVMQGAVVPTRDDCQFAIDFVIECVLRLGEFDYQA
jgi:hypothetical protein